jgi:hypothetical protein
METYISECFNFPNTEVIQYSIDDENNVLEVALLGQSIDNKTIDELSAQLADYKLDNLSLKITQTQTSTDTDTEKLKELIQNLISNNVDINSFKEFMYRTETLEKDSQDTTSTINTLDFEKISKSIQTLYTNVDTCYIGYVKDYLSTEIDSNDDTIMVLLGTSVKLSSEEYSRLEDWLRIELNTENFILLENSKEAEISETSQNTELTENFTAESDVESTTTTQELE